MDVEEALESLEAVATEKLDAEEPKELKLMEICGCLIASMWGPRPR